MQGKTRVELYQAFLDFVANDIQGERSRVNRKVVSVFVWCFLIPAVITMTTLIFIKLRIFPRGFRSHLDWAVLVFPVLYSLYILSSEVLVQVPKTFRRGGIATTLGQSFKEGAWRDRVSESMIRTVDATADEWEWIIANFKMDLEAMQYRTRYLTALGGAVFFLIMQGIDSLTDGVGKVAVIKATSFGLVEVTSGDLAQYVGLFLFLILLYLSGSQTTNHLFRYLNCAELAQKGFRLLSRSR
jgi:hypothetical protein